MKIIIGVDPGASCGLAVILGGTLELAWQGPPKQMLQVLQARLDQHKKDDLMVSCEQFIELHGRGRPMTSQPDAQMIIGKVQVMCELYGRVCHMQSPSDAMALGTNAQLRAVGMQTTPQHVMQPDANDANMAIRHALLTLSRYSATTFDWVMYGEH